MTDGNPWKSSPENRLNPSAARFLAGINICLLSFEAVFFLANKRFLANNEKDHPINFGIACLSFSTFIGQKIVGKDDKTTATSKRKRRRKTRDETVCVFCFIVCESFQVFFLWQRKGRLNLVNLWLSFSLPLRKPIFGSGRRKQEIQVTAVSFKVATPQRLMALALISLWPYDHQDGYARYNPDGRSYGRYAES